LGHITEIHDNDRPENVIMGYTAHDVAATVARQGATVTLTSLFPVENMTAAEHEVQDALREGVEIQGSVMPVGIEKDASGRATALKMAKCKMEGNVPKRIEGTEYSIKADLIVSAIGQMGDMKGLENFDNGRGFIDADANYQVKGKPGHFVAGDIIRPHLLTTAIGQAAIAVDAIDAYLKGQEQRKRPKVDVRHFSLLNKLHEANLEPEDYSHEQVRGTSESKFAVHNYEDRSFAEIIPSDELFLGHFKYTPRIKRSEIHISADEVLGNFTERMQSLNTQQAMDESKRCMSCGMCFECDNCVIFCPQTAVMKTPKSESTTGRYVFTDYGKCIGCHICADVCPTGYIDMGMGE
jgi:Pyruvate/2-oxoacid:ferredoxin oxidoreductase delta subunit